jgi:hypothetical protein
MSEKPKIEYVEFVVSLPKQVLDFLEAHKASLNYKDVEAYINLGILQVVRADLENGEFDGPTLKLLNSILDGEDA